jgi:hypothetical protein
LTSSAELRLHLRHNDIVGIRAFRWHKSARCPIVIAASKRQRHRRWGLCRTTQRQDEAAETMPSTTLMALRQSGHEHAPPHHRQW